jgi:hypothetical protein
MDPLIAGPREEAKGRSEQAARDKLPVARGRSAQRGKLAVRVPLGASLLKGTVPAALEPVGEPVQTAGEQLVESPLDPPLAAEELVVSRRGSISRGDGAVGRAFRLAIKSSQQRPGPPGPVVRRSPPRHAMGKLQKNVLRARHQLPTANKPCRERS